MRKNVADSTSAVMTLFGNLNYNTEVWTIHGYGLGPAPYLRNEQRIIVKDVSIYKIANIFFDIPDYVPEIVLDC